MDRYETTAAALVALLGGAGNIAGVASCVTRLRITLADRARVDDGGVRAHPAVLGLIDADVSQVHIVVGPAVVGRLAAAVMSQAGQGPGV